MGVFEKVSMIEVEKMCKPLHCLLEYGGIFLTSGNKWAQYAGRTPKKREYVS